MNVPYMSPAGWKVGSCNLRSCWTGLFCWTGCVFIAEDFHTQRRGVMSLFSRDLHLMPVQRLDQKADGWCCAMWKKTKQKTAILNKKMPISALRDDYSVDGSRLHFVCLLQNRLSILCPRPNSLTWNSQDFVNHLAIQNHSNVIV